MFGRIIQTVGVVLTLAAIQLEIYYKADIYLILATAGSVVFTVGTKYHYYREKKNQEKGGDQHGSHSEEPKR